MKRWGARLVDVMKHLPHCNTMTRRVANQSQRGTFSPGGKTDPAGHQPSISMSWDQDVESYSKSTAFPISLQRAQFVVFFI